MHTELLINGFFLGGPCDSSVGKTLQRSPYDGSVVGTAAEGTFREGLTAISAADDAFKTWSQSPRHQRQALLRKVASLVRERSAELSELLAREIGKPIVWAEGEVARTALTFERAADALATFGLTQMPVDLDPRGDGYRCNVERFPIGVVFCIVPYNWPLNLAAHKIAPALATGNTVVVKPSGQSPMSTMELCRIIHEAGAPEGVINVVAMTGKDAEKCLADPRVKMLSFTGSPAVGWHLKEKLWDRRVSLELGSDSSAIVMPDADLDWVVSRLVPGAFGYAGQICISIQHARVHSSVYAELRTRLIEATKACPTGDPLDRATVCGPLISETAADRVESWISEATSAGASLLAGGTRAKNLISPTLLEKPSPSCQVATEEVFGPVLTLQPFESLEEVIGQVNASKYGIQTGIFTQNLSIAERAYREIETGGLIVNDFPTLRFDNMPYGGVKRSGFGREGVEFTMHEMTDPRTLLVRTLPAN